MSRSRFRRRVLAGTAVVAIASTSTLASIGAVNADLIDSGAAQVRESPIRAANSPNAIAGSYLVVLKETPALVSQLTSVVSAVAETVGVTAHRTFTTALHGFAARMTEEQARVVAADPRVAYVQQNQRFTVREDTTPWNLDRSDQRAQPLDDAYEPPNTGAGATVYVIDTGINTAHEDFGGRASIGTDTVRDGRNGQDCHGHGSHVAGIVAGTRWGVARETSVVAVRVLDCTGAGTTETVVAGIDWITKHATRPAVANMSLGGPADQIFDTALRRSIESGITYVVAAGNENVDACTVSPARVPAALTVGATDSTDTRAGFSNFGSCVDLFAPGVDIRSVAISTPTGTRIANGTSMASPHVAAAAALYLSEDPDATSEDVAVALTTNATPDLISNPGAGSPNRLLYVGELTSPTPTLLSLLSGGSSSRSTRSTGQPQQEGLGVLPLLGQHR